MVLTFGNFIKQRVMAVARSWRSVVRLSLAPAIAFWISIQLLEHDQAFFAPIAAILALTVGDGERKSIVVQIIFGSAIGVLVSELLILAIGRGPWQLVVVAAFAAISAKAAGLKGIALTQAVIAASMLVAVVPTEHMANPALTRFVDALVGGAVGFAMTLLVPANPLREINEGIKALLNELADILELTADALCSLDADAAYFALTEARATQPMIEKMATVADAVSEVARFSPFRWRQRGQVDERIDAIVDIDNAVRNTRVLTRRAAAMLRHGESVPPALSEALRELADLARTDPQNIDALVDVARQAIESVRADLTINNAAVASQVRAIVADMMTAAGATRDDLDTRLDF